MTKRSSVKITTSSIFITSPCGNREQTTARRQGVLAIIITDFDSFFKNFLSSLAKSEKKEYNANRKGHHATSRLPIWEIRRTAAHFDEEQLFFCG